MLNCLTDIVLYAQFNLAKLSSLSANLQLDFKAKQFMYLNKDIVYLILHIKGASYAVSWYLLALLCQPSYLHGFLRNQIKPTPS